MANPIVTIEMESGAVMSGELYPEIAPNTVNNFIALANSGFTTAWCSTASSQAL